MAIEDLQQKIRKYKNPTMVCICPALAELPPCVRQQAEAQYGQTLRAAAEAYRVFSFEILEALRETVPAVSIVSGAFTALGADGVAAMQEVLHFAADCGYYVLLDLMRNDLGAAAQMMADACFGSVPVGEAAFTPYPCDGVLTTAFLGSDSLSPFVRYCEEGKNVFLVSRSSNKSAREVQDLLSGDRIMYQVMADLAMRWSKEGSGRSGFREVGISVGATSTTALKALRGRYDSLFFLVPGYGEQGAGAKDAQFAFNQLGHGAAVLAGRSILYAYQKSNDPEIDYRTAACEAAAKMKKQLAGFVTVL